MIHESEDREIDDEEARAWAEDIYGVTASPVVLRLLQRAPHDDARHEVARHLLIGARLAAGEAPEELQREGWITDRDLLDLDDDE